MDEYKLLIGVVVGSLCVLVPYTIVMFFQQRAAYFKDTQERMAEMRRRIEAETKDRP